MHLLRCAVPIVLSLPFFVSNLNAQDRGAFLVRLGNDTTGVEQFEIGKTKVELLQAIRAPRVRLRQATLTLGPNGQFAGVEATVTDPGMPGSKPVQTMSATLMKDSIAGENRADTTVRRYGRSLPPGTEVPAISMWVMFERLSLRRIQAKADSVRVPMYFLGSPDVFWAAIRRLGKDSIDIETTFDQYHARIDREGRILGLRPIRGTQQFSLERFPTVDVKAYAAAFAAREKADGALGAFSPRDTARADAAGAHLWIDYGRPSKRGRVVFGGVVPWGTIWRTGANAATQFSTDKPIAFGSTVVPAGKYTLWTLPTPQGWTLIINSETGQWGTEHKPERDLYQIPMSVSTKSDVTEKFFIHIADEGGKGQWHFVWDQTVAAVDFAVQQ
jgi:hypothetical protein